MASRFPTDFGSLVTQPSPEVPAGVFEDTPSLAQSAIGQNNVSATPLQMALVAAAVANAGQVPVPHVLAQVEEHDTGRATSSFRNATWTRAMSAEAAADLTAAMIEVVERGSAQRLGVDGLVIGAKTGTAQLSAGSAASHAWIIAFGGRPNERAELAVAVLVEGGEGIDEQTGGGIAAPIARDLFQQYFR